MEESKITGVKLQLTRPRSMTVERVANDWNSQTPRMRRVNSELMGTSGQGLEEHAGKTVLNADLFPSSNSDFSVDGVVDLHGPIVDIKTKGEFKSPALSIQFPLQQSDITFLGLATMELNRNMAVGGGGPRDNHQARGIHIQPVHGRLFRTAGIESPYSVAHAIQLLGPASGH